MLAQSAHHPSSHYPARLFRFSPCLCQSSLMFKTPLVQSTTACQHHYFMSMHPAGASPLLPCGLWLGQPSHGCISNLLSQGMLEGMLSQSAHHPLSHYPARLFRFSPCLCQRGLMFKTPLAHATTAYQRHHFMSLPPDGASPLLPCGLWLGQPSHGCISNLLSQGMLEGVLAQSAHHPSSHYPARLFRFSPCLCLSCLMFKTPLAHATTAYQRHHFMSMPPAGASPLLPCAL